MSNLVIVAIPAENDRVWKISSEKVPHLTLLFLGDADKVDNLQSIVQFVEHAADTSLRRFHLPVDRRGELGEDEADVLFFKKGRYDYKAVRDFRMQLLMDNNIRKAYDSTEQFDGPWLPHLTLGYPESPANDDDDDYGFYEVSFEKIAVWTGDYDGPEFLLTDPWEEWNTTLDSPMDIAMSDIRDIDPDVLSHYGVKGMRWGVRRSDVSSAAKKVGGAAKALGRNIGDSHFEKQIQRPAGQQAVQKAIVDKASSAYKRTDLPALRQKPEYQEAKKLKHRLFNPKDPATKAYRKEAKETYIKRLEESANSMTNTSGTRQYTIRERGWELPAQGGNLPKSTYYWDVTSRQIKHADGDDVTTTLEVIVDNDGFITDLKPVETDDTLAQSAIEDGAEFLVHSGVISPEEFLEQYGIVHFGVKGMRWGVRRSSPPVATTPTATSHVPGGSRRRTKIKTSGGENHPAHDDAIAVAEARIKMKRSGTAALSNAELQRMAKRLQLETQVAQLTSSRGQKFITRQLEQEGQQQFQKGTRKVVKKGVKKAGKAAATTAVTVALL